MANTTNVNIKDLGGSEIELAWEIPTEEFMKYESEALKNLGQDVKIDGFRPGHIPNEILIKHLGEERILYEMASIAISNSYPKIITEQKIDAIGRPEITITKIAKNNPLGVKAKTAVTPKIELPDYKAIARKKNSEPEEAVTVEDKEVEQIIEEIRRSRAIHNHEPGEEHKDGDEVLPELNDDFVKTLGQFESVADFKEKIRANILEEKRARAKEKHRLAIVDEIIKNSRMEIPKILIDSELDKMLSEIKAEIEHMGLKFDEYLSHLKKTEEELLKAWQPDAERRVKFGLVLNKIAQDEKIEAPKEDVEKEIKHLVEHYPNANPERVRTYVESMIVHQKTFEFLENQK
jgi:FKBP-type peptidyl-prolyl cis-trans isomerase (trigger factor)